MTRAPRMPLRVGRELLLFSFFLFIAGLDTWPLARQLDTAVPDRGDPLLLAWIVDWTSDALLHDPLHLFEAPLFPGAQHSLAFSEHLTAEALLVLPFKI